MGYDYIVKIGADASDIKSAIDKRLKEVDNAKIKIRCDDGDIQRVLSQLSQIDSKTASKIKIDIDGSGVYRTLEEIRKKAGIEASGIQKEFSKIDIKSITSELEKAEKELARAQRTKDNALLNHNKDKLKSDINNLYNGVSNSPVQLERYSQQLLNLVATFEKAGGKLSELSPQIQSAIQELNGKGKIGEASSFDYSKFDEDITRWQQKVNELKSTIESYNKAQKGLTESTSSGAAFGSSAQQSLQSFQEGLERTRQSVDAVREAYERMINEKNEWDRASIKRTLNGDYSGNSEIESTRTVLSQLKNAHESYDLSTANNWKWEEQYQWAVKFVSLYENYGSRDNGTIASLSKHTELYNQLKPLVEGYKADLQAVLDYKPSSNVQSSIEQTTQKVKELKQVEAEATSKNPVTGTGTGINSEAVNSLIQLLKQLNAQIEQIRTAFGTIDDSSDIPNLLTSIQEIKKGLSDTLNQIQQLSTVASGLKFDGYKELHAIIYNIKNVLSGFSEGSFTFGISEESLSGIITKINEATEAIKNFKGVSLGSNVAIDGSGVNTEISKQNELQSELQETISLENEYKSLLAKDFSTKNKSEATAQLKKAYETYLPFFKNNEETTNFTEAGAKAGYAYYKAFNEAVSKGIAVSNLNKYSTWQNSYGESGLFNEYTKTTNEDFNDVFNQFATRMQSYSSIVDEIRSKFGNVDLNYSLGKELGLPDSDSLSSEINKYVGAIERLNYMKAKPLTEDDSIGFSKNEIQNQIDLVEMYKKNIIDLASLAPKIDLQKQITDQVTGAGQAQAQASSMAPVQVKLEADMQSLNASIQGQKDQIAPVDVKLNVTGTTTSNTSATITNVDSTVSAINTQTSAFQNGGKEIANAIQTEVQALDSLKNKLAETTVYVQTKTSAFQNEGTMVASTVQGEINNLDSLKNKLKEIINIIGELQKKMPSGSDEGGSANNGLTQTLSLLSEQLQGIDVSSLNQISTSLKQLNSASKAAENLELVSVALTEFKNSLSGMSAQNDLLKTIDSIVGKVDSLKNLVKVLENSTKKIKEVEKTLDSTGSTGKSGSKVTGDGSKSSKDVDRYIEKTKQAESMLKSFQQYASNNNLFGDAFKRASEEVDKLNNKLKNKESVNYSSELGKIENRLNAIKNASNILNDFKQFAGGNANLLGAFEAASTKFSSLNEQLQSGSISLQRYNSEINKINNSLNASKNAVGFVNPNEVKSATDAMKEYIRSISNNKASMTINETAGTVTGKWQEQNGVVRELTLSYDGLTGAMIATKDVTGQAKTFVQSLSDSFSQGWKNVARYVMSFASFYRIIAIFKKGLTTVKELDNALTEMRKVSDESISTLKNFQVESFDMAGAIGTTAKQLQNSTADWMRLGESIAEATESAKASNILLNVSEFEGIDQATESLVAMSAAYEELDKMEIIDKLNLIGNNFAISTDGLASALQRSASALKTAGNDMDEAIALVTAGNRVVQNPESVGAGLRTIALRITGTEEAKAELEELGEDTSDYIVQTSAKSQEAIKNFTKVASNNFEGFDILDDNGNFKSTYEILLGISEIYEEILATDKKFGSNMANGLLETLAGKNRSNIAASILQSPDVLKEAYEASANDAAGSAEKENEKYLDSIEGKVQQFTNEVQEFWFNLIDSETVKGFVELCTKLISVLADLADALGEVGSIAATIGTVSMFKTMKKNSGGRVKKFALKIKYATESFSREVCEFWCTSE